MVSTELSGLLPAPTGAAVAPTAPLRGSLGAESRGRGALGRRRGGGDPEGKRAGRLAPAVSVRALPNGVPIAA